MSGINRTAWEQALRETINMDLPPSSAVTVREFADMTGYSISQASKRLKQMVSAGRAVLTKKTQRMADGGLRKVPAYDLVATEDK